MVNVAKLGSYGRDRVMSGFVQSERVKRREPTREELKESLEASLSIASLFAENGGIDKGMEPGLKSALRIAEKLREDISDQVRRIEVIGYNQCVESQLDAARRYVGEKDVPKMVGALERADYAAKQLGRNIDSDVREILHSY